MNCIRVTEDRNLFCALANTVLIIELNTVMDLLAEQFICIIKTWLREVT